MNQAMFASFIFYLGVGLLWVTTTLPVTTAAAGLPTLPDFTETEDTAAEKSAPQASEKTVQPTSDIERDEGKPGASTSEAASTTLLDAAPAANVNANSSSTTALNWYEDVDVNAYVSTSYQYNWALRAPLTQLSAGRYFDRRSATLQIDVALLTLQAAVEKPYDIGFRIDLVHAAMLPQVLSLGNVGLWQAAVAVMAPLGSGLRMDAGSFASDIGSEHLDSFEHVYESGASFEQSNLNFSRSLLFVGIPPLLTGLRLGYDFAPALTLQLFAVNGWQANVQDNNTGKSFGALLQGSILPGLGWSISYLGGPEQTSNNHDLRHLGDAVLQWYGPYAGLKLEGMLAYEAYHQNGPRTLWRRRGGVLAALRVQLGRMLALSLRGEYVQARRQFANELAFASPPGLRLVLPSLPQARLFEVTVTPSLQLGDNVVLRLEGRYDRALLQATPFAGQAAQTTLAANLAFAF